MAGSLMYDRTKDRVAGTSGKITLLFTSGPTLSFPDES
jgi:hypothetical protein